MDPHTVLWVALALTEGVGALGLAAMTRAHGGARRLVEAARSRRTVPPEVLPLRLDQARVLTKLRAATTPDALARAERRARTWTADGTRLLHPESADYPPLLTHIIDPPPLLFVRGRLPAGALAPYGDARTVAIIGTRRSSRWGDDFTVRLARDLAAAGVVVVSGLALGIDGAAHRGALQAGGGLTVAVLGSGTDRVHPPAHRALAAQVAADGALVSEHPPGTTAQPGHFPRRNRIVSGLARAVVVVEAPESSGTKITASFALDQGRTIMCVPSRPDLANGRGTLALLRDGATPVGSAEHVLASLDWPLAPAATAPAPSDALERHLLATLRTSGAAALEALSPPDTPPGRVLAALTELEIAGRVRPDGKGGWRPT